MRHTWYKSLAVAAALGLLPVSSTVFADVPAIEKNQEEAGTNDALTEDEKTLLEAGKTLKDGEGKDDEAVKEEKAEEEKEKKEELFPINGAPLSEEDFWLGEISLGDSIDVAKAAMGPAKEIRRGSLADTYVWDGCTIRVLPDFLDTYSGREDISLGDMVSGISSWDITGGDLTTARGIRAGSRRENVLRAYGRPSQIAWDGEKDRFIFTYNGIEENLTFTISQDVVKSIHVSKGKTAVKATEEGGETYLPASDFSMAGLTLHHLFKNYSFMEWEKKMTNPHEEVWYYRGYGVRMTPKENWIRGFFLTDNRMLTPRGLAMGDEASTAELLYGPPHKIELDSRSGTPRTAAVYFSKGEEQVLIIYLKDKKVDGIAVADNPQHKKQA